MTFFQNLILFLHVSTCKSPLISALKIFFYDTQDFSGSVINNRYLHIFKSNNSNVSPVNTN